MNKTVTEYRLESRYDGGRWNALRTYTNLSTAEFNRDRRTEASRERGEPTEYRISQRTVTFTPWTPWRPMKAAVPS